jgi:hypothetical protein
MAGKHPDFHALSLESNQGRIRVLKTPVHVSSAFVVATTPEANRPAALQVEGLWDTGASGTVITQRVVDACGLQQTGMAKVRGAYGDVTDRPTFLINLILMGRVQIEGLPVSLGEPQGTDLLIGMDIITLGDFAITHEHGKTFFSFRIPSCHTIDYVKQARHHRESKEAEAAKKQRGGGSSTNPGKRPR